MKIQVIELTHELQRIAAIKAAAKSGIPEMNPIRAELKGDDKALACGFVVRTNSPLLALCRKLVDAGHDPLTPLDAYRDDTLCLRVRSIGEAAKLRVNPHGTAFILLRRPSYSPAHESSNRGSLGL